MSFRVMESSILVELWIVLVLVVARQSGNRKNQRLHLTLYLHLTYAYCIPGLLSHGTDCN